MDVKNRTVSPDDTATIVWKGKPVSFVFPKATAKVFNEWGCFSTAYIKRKHPNTKLLLYRQDDPQDGEMVFLGDIRDALGMV